MVRRIFTYEDGLAQVTETVSDETVVTYRCVTGHEIAAESLEQLTQKVTLDRGAVVRVCREHGAPIAESRTQYRTDSSLE